MMSLSTGSIKHRKKVRTETGRKMEKPVPKNRMKFKIWNHKYLKIYYWNMNHKDGGSGFWQLWGVVER